MQAGGGTAPGVGVRLAAKDEFANHWTLVLACFVGFSFYSVMTASLSMFIKPLADEFGWSRTLIASGVSISALVTAILSPFVGALIDRLGARRLAIPGIVANMGAMCLFALATESGTVWLALWAFYSVISIATKSTIWLFAVSRVFEAGRGLALGLVLCGTAAALAISPPLAGWLIDVWGWRIAYVLLSLGWGGVTLVLCWLFLRDGAESKAGEAAPAPVDRASLPGLTIAEAWRDAALWRIAAITFTIMAVTMGLQIHQVEILGQAGISRGNAALLASLFGVAGIVGKLVTGWLVDRYRANWIGGATLAATALAFLLLIDGIRSPALIVLAIVINGYTAGTKLQITVYLTARYAGMKNFGAVSGTMNSLTAAGTGIGPPLAGYVFDTAGNYTAFLVLGVIGSLVSGLLVLTLPRYPQWEKPANPAEPGNSAGAPLDDPQAARR